MNEQAINPLRRRMSEDMLSWRMAFHVRNCVGTRDDRSFAVQWLACALPCRRFAGALTDVCARLRADVDRYSLTVRDLHPLLLAGLPAHSNNPHKFRRTGRWSAGLRSE